jgi:nitroreductase
MDGDQSASVAVLDRPVDVEKGRVASSPSSDDVPIGPDAGVMAIMATTRAMRRLAPDQVPEDVIRSVIQAATWAPSADNWQVAAYVVVTDRETMARLAVLWQRVSEEMLLLFDALGVEDGSDPSSRRVGEALAYQRDHFAETPALIIVCDDDRALKQRARGTVGTLRRVARRVGWRRAVGLARAMTRTAERSEGASIYPAVENLLLAARAHGLGACLTTWHLLAEEEFKRIVGIPADVKTFAVIPIGWPLGHFGPVRRRAVDEVIHLQRW